MTERWACVLATHQEIKLSTECVCPPIPIRDWDWRAIDADTYDVDYNDEDGLYSDSPTGEGKTEIEAINDLCEQLEEKYYEENESVVPETVDASATPAEHRPSD